MLGIGLSVLMFVEVEITFRSGPESKMRMCLSYQVSKSSVKAD